METSLAKIIRGRNTPLRVDGVVSAMRQVTVTEECLSGVCQSLANYTRKSAKFRNASDDLAEALRNLWTGCPSHSDKSLSNDLQLLSDSLAAIADLRDDHVMRMSRGVKQVSRFEEVCRKAKHDIKNCRKVDDSHSILDVDSSSVQGEESGVAESPVVADLTATPINDIISRFEENKVAGMTAILADLGRAELTYHCKAVQVLAEALSSFSQIQINVESQV